MNNNDQQSSQSQSGQEGSYEYVFSSGSQNTQSKQEKSKKSAFGGAFRLLTIVLCVLLPFGSGFVGALCANSFSNYLNEKTTETDDTLFYPYPEEILNKDPASPSDKGSAGDEVFAVSQVASAVLDTVVVVNATVKQVSSWGQESTGVSTGSGVIITANGYILTCYHVIDQATSITVTLHADTANEKQYAAALVGGDEASDIAVLLIDAPEALPYAGLGNSGDLVLGEQVVAVGNPLGELHRTVTTGIISGLDRKIATSDGGVMTLLQTDAAINSGNSGGGLFNLAGELIGIVNAKYADTGVEGLAFAIPIDWAYEIQLDLIQYGYVRGTVDSGLETVEVNQENLNYYAFQFGIKTYGVYVVSSEYCEDLQNKDLILSINGVSISTEAEMKAAFNACKIGDTVSIEYSRNGTTYTTELTLQEYVPDYIKNNQS